MNAGKLSRLYQPKTGAIFFIGPGPLLNLPCAGLHYNDRLWISIWSRPIRRGAIRRRRSSNSSAGLGQGEKHQVLLGVTGSGKTFTMAKVIEQLNRPTLVLAHNKTLAAQLYQEFRGFFPENAVEYFVSYYDYYQPEAYIASTDTYIEKESTINDEIDRMRLSATRSLFERRDVVIVASVSCIYGLGSPEAYYGMLLHAGAGPADFAPGDSVQAGRDPLRTQRSGFQARDLSRPRRHDRSASDLRKHRVSHRALGRRGREAQHVRSAYRRRDPIAGSPHDLSEDVISSCRGLAWSRRSKPSRTS